MTRYFAATDSTGHTSFRSTERNYTHAVIIPSDRAYSWAGRLDLAVKALAQFRRLYPSKAAVFEIVETQEISAIDFRAAKRAAKVKSGEITSGPQILAQILNGQK